MNREKVHELLAQVYKLAEETGDYAKYPDNVYELYEFDSSSKFIEVNGVKIFTQYIKGGYEGAGEEYYIILNINNGGKITYWKIPGYYQSYDGVTMEPEDLYQVKPVEKTYIIWDKL